jgi:type IV secretion system protein TrbE
MQITEHRTKAHGLPDLLLYDSLIEDGILLQQDGSLLAAWSFRGPDMASATHAEMAGLSARLNRVLRLGSGWMIQCDAIRSLAPEYPDEGAFPDTATRIIDDERRQQFMAEGAHYESNYFLTLTYLPPRENEEKLSGWVFDGKSDIGGGAARALSRFKSKISGFEETFKCLFPAERLRRVDFDDQGFPCVHDRLLRYLRSCVTGEDLPFALPEFPVFLNDIISSQDFCGGVEPRIGSLHLRTIAIDGFPRTSYPGILGALDAVPIR